MRNLVNIVIIMILFFACGKNNECLKILPNRPVNIEINLDLPEGIELKNKNYKIYENQGINGVLVYNSTNGWKAYDLATPHLDYKDKCSKMVIDDSNWFLKNNCDGALFLLDNGVPWNEKSSCPLKEYFVVKNNNIIYIRN